MRVVRLLKSFRELRLVFVLPNLASTLAASITRCRASEWAYALIAFAWRRSTGREYALRGD